MHGIGEVTLNISFVLYFVFYLPQLWVNFRYKKITELSLGFHALLLIGATADLYYGFGRIHQWQYICVSVILFVCLVVQHVHLIMHVNKFENGVSVLVVLSLVIIAMLYGLFHALNNSDKLVNLFVWMGWVERIAYWLYSFPQLKKNYDNKSAACISPIFIIIAVVTSLCDSISAWTLSWGPSSLYGAPIALLVHLVLLYQWFSLRVPASKQDGFGWYHA
jgi:PQ loop repeat.